VQAGSLLLHLLPPAQAAVTVLLAYDGGPPGPAHSAHFEIAIKINIAYANRHVNF